jgi:hypothetical protein
MKQRTFAVRMEAQNFLDFIHDLNHDIQEKAAS